MGRIDCLLVVFLNIVVFMLVHFICSPPSYNIISVSLKKAGSFRPLAGGPETAAENPRDGREVIVTAL